MSMLHQNASFGTLFWKGVRALRPSSAPDHSGAARWLRGARATLRLWQKRSRYRHELLALDDHIVRDVGLSRYDAMMEARKHRAWLGSGP